MILFCKILVSRIDDIEQAELLKNLGVENTPEPDEYWVSRYVDITDCRLLFPCEMDGDEFGKLCLEYNNDNMYVTNVDFKDFEPFISSKRKDLMMDFAEGKLTVYP